MRQRDSRVKSEPAGYPGGKAALGVYQRIINEIPPHDLYVEPFLGGGAVMYYKRPALRDVGIDANADTIAQTKKYLKWGDLSVGDGVGYLERLLRVSKIVHTETLSDRDWRQLWRPFPDPVVPLSGGNGHKRVVLYVDPPYIFSSRRSQRRIYTWEASDQAREGKDEAWHHGLLKLLNQLPFYVLLSGYQNPLYEKLLPSSKWRAISYQAPLRGGNVATEYLWCNFPKPRELHDYRYLGSNRRERERIKRKKQRWVAKLGRMPDLERYAVLAAIQESATDLHG